MTLLISRIIISLLVIYALFVVWSKDVDLIKWTKNQIEGKLPINQEKKAFSYSEKDKMIAQHYFYALSEFIVKFRFNLYCLIPSDANEPEIEEVFSYGKDMLKKPPNIQKIDESLIKLLFSKYNFNNLLINFTPTPGQQHPTNIGMLIGELMNLNKKCDEILKKYASTGNHKLIQDIEVIKNRTDNLLGPFGLRNTTVIPETNLNAIAELFVLIKSSFNLITEIKNQN